MQASLTASFRGFLVGVAACKTRAGNRKRHLNLPASTRFEESLLMLEGARGGDSIS